MAHNFQLGSRGNALHIQFEEAFVFWVGGVFIYIFLYIYLYLFEHYKNTVLFKRAREFPYAYDV